MSEEDFLLAIAQLAIALIAFTNIVVALRQMGGGNLSEFQLHVVRLFSVCGFSAIFVALLPILLLYLGLSTAWLWRVSNPPLALSVILIHSCDYRSKPDAWRRLVSNSESDRPLPGIRRRIRRKSSPKTIALPAIRVLAR
jgi:hypothetical protein